MRLSEAIMLGDSLRTRYPNGFLQRSSGQVCGCAIGGAWLAVGMTLEQRVESIQCADEITQKWWPWVDYRLLGRVSAMFSNVCAGKTTFEQLVDYVRSIEPPEPDESAVISETQKKLVQV